MNIDDFFAVLSLLLVDQPTASAFKLLKRGGHSQVTHKNIPQLDTVGFNLLTIVPSTVIPEATLNATVAYFLLRNTHSGTKPVAHPVRRHVRTTISMFLRTIVVQGFSMAGCVCSGRNQTIIIVVIFIIIDYLTKNKSRHVQIIPHVEKFYMIVIYKTVDNG